MHSTDFNNFPSCRFKDRARSVDYNVAHPVVLNILIVLLCLCLVLWVQESWSFYYINVWSCGFKHDVHSTDYINVWSCGFKNPARRRGTTVGPETALNSLLPTVPAVLGLNPSLSTAVGDATVSRSVVAAAAAVALVCRCCSCRFDWCWCCSGVILLLHAAFVVVLVAVIVVLAL